MRLQPVRFLALLMWVSVFSPAQGHSAEPQPTPSEAPQAASDSKPVVQFDRSENGVIYFKVPAGVQAKSEVKADLYDLNLLGTIQPMESGLPYFLFSGRPCPDCLQERHIYLVRPTSEKPAKMIYPGKIIDSRSRDVLLDSRAFFGRCLRNVPGDVYVVFQRERVDRRNRLQSSVYVAQPFPDRLGEKLIERGLPKLDHTLQSVRRKQCFEIDGRYRLMVKKPLDLRSRAKRAADAEAEAADEGEDDTPTKENQTDSELPASSDS